MTGYEWYDVAVRVGMGGIRFRSLAGRSRRREERRLRGGHALRVAFVGRGGIDVVARVASVLRASYAVCGIVCVLYASPSKHAQGLGKGIGAGWRQCFDGGAESGSLAGSRWLVLASSCMYGLYLYRTKGV